jgi:hypothetical protein
VTLHVWELSHCPSVPVTLLFVHWHAPDTEHVDAAQHAPSDDTQTLPADSPSHALLYTIFS